MIPSPIPRVLSTLRRHRVRALLMGGQACILYGAAEFSRDVDVAVAIESANLGRLRAALAALEAEPVYFPRLTAAALRRGHVCQFRCNAAKIGGVRLDVMGVLRGVGAFETLWRRRAEIDLGEGLRIPVMSLQDLVSAKKTQRDRDWPMVRRLVEADVARAPKRVDAAQSRFWLRECRSPELLCSLVARFPRLAAREARRREALRLAVGGDVLAVSRALRDEEDRERDLDREHWAPLRAELEEMRLGRRGTAARRQARPRSGDRSR